MHRYLRFESPDYHIVCVAGMEVFIFGAEENAGAPLVFVIHGLGQTSANVFNECRNLKEEGFISCAFDVRNHGERTVDSLANMPGVRSAVNRYGITVATAFDIKLCIDFLPAVCGLRFSSVGVTGVSLGAHIALRSMVIDKRINCCAAIIGAGTFKQHMEIRHKTTDYSMYDWRDFFPSEIESVIEEYDPIERCEVLADRPILLINGGKDVVVSAECGETLFKKLEPFYTDKSKLKYRLFEECGHTCTQEMREESRKWLKNWLMKDSLSEVL